MAFHEERKHIGDLGEAIVRRFLIGKGYKILESNYRKKWGEIDVIAEKKGKIHFVEVKAIQKKEGGEAYMPEENIHEKKLKRIFATAYSYVGERKHKGQWQVDAAAVFLDKENKKARVRYTADVMF